jgi:hypothetical protein
MRRATRTNQDNPINRKSALSVCLFLQSVEGRQAGRQAGRRTDSRTDRQTDRQTDGRTDRRTDRRTDGQTYRHTDRQATVDLILTAELSCCVSNTTFTYANNEFHGAEAPCNMG